MRKQGRFEKLPVQVEAFRYEGDPFEVFDWVAKVSVGGPRVEMRVGSGSLIIPTLEGDHEVLVGDYIIQGVKGEFYPCKPDIFALTYREVPHE